MKISIRRLAATWILAISLSASVSAEEPVFAADVVSAAQFAEGTSELTQVAISPLLGVAVMGASRYLQADEQGREELPFHAQPWFLGPAWLMLLLNGAAKINPFVPLKTALNVVDQFEDKISAILAAAILTPAYGQQAAAFALSFMQQPEPVAGLLQYTPPSGVSELSGTVVAAIATVCGAVVFSVVFMAGHSFNVLMLLCPVPFVDGVLGVMKLAFISLLLGANAVHPMLGLGVSLVVIVVAWFVAGWSFRLTVFGSLLAWDLLRLGRPREYRDGEAVTAFAGRGLKRVPRRSMGRAERRADGALVFSYRPLLLLKRREVLLEATQPVLGQGALFAQLLNVTDDGKATGLLSFRHCQLRRLEAVASALSIPETRAIGLRKGWRALKTWCAGLFGRGSDNVELAPSAPPPVPG